LVKNHETQTPRFFERPVQEFLQQVFVHGFRGSGAFAEGNALLTSKRWAQAAVPGVPAGLPPGIGVGKAAAVPGAPAGVPPAKGVPWAQA